jgi:hypothetical protein
MGGEKVTETGVLGTRPVVLNCTGTSAPGQVLETDVTTICDGDGTPDKLPLDDDPTHSKTNLRESAHERNSKMRRTSPWVLHHTEPNNRSVATNIGIFFLLIEHHTLGWVGFRADSTINQFQALDHG